MDDTSDNQSVTNLSYTASETSRKSKTKGKEKSMQELIQQAAQDKKKLKVLKDEIKDSRMRQQDAEKQITKLVERNLGKRVDLELANVV